MKESGYGSDRASTDRQVWIYLYMKNLGLEDAISKLI